MAEHQDPAASAASSSASTLILLQISSRLLTFVLNQLLVRLVSPSVFGLANIQLELLISTILFVSRDAFRTILIRNEPGSSASSSKAVATSSRVRRGVSNSIHNISLLPIPIGFTLTAIACTVYVRYISPLAMRSLPSFHVSIALYALGALSELVYEPLIIRAVRLGRPTWRVKAEGIAVLAKTISTIATIILLPLFSTPSFIQSWVEDERSTALLAFGIGQATYSIVTLLVLLLFFFREYGIAPTIDLYVPRSDPVSPPRYFDTPTLSLCATMSSQGVLKHCLTEADKFAIAKYSSLEDQGGYALASNYGSLVARILFQPVEETCRIVFSSELTQDGGERKRRVREMLGGLFKMHFLLGLVMVTFGGPLSKTFLYVMAGERWALQTSAPDILAAYTWYLPIMGLNGIVEGFVQSVARKEEIQRYNRVLFTASATFIGGLVMSRSKVVEGLVGKTGLVWANAVSLAVRAGWCWKFLRVYFGGDGELGAKAALPGRITLAVLGSVAAVLRVAVPRTMPMDEQLVSAAESGRIQALNLLAPTVGLTSGCLAVVVGSIVVFERKALIKALRSLRGQPHETRKTKRS
ncbi:nuclear division Rft1 protein [Pseudozyma hubeiensis SY62]|uniref:Man(5)GlcNAc(2)-PP-dolichol translocation protein RFT1 n=1 Tax=Pseudozyma hubeiensis (strain SY62) TaxID=1305764 RepID=R9PBI0_PSEHS|nr:nuclear division Rft1 protein [Pseudozyma hubeiensis SY62]GAC98597.1 nuclear division Rft1 protein [Pseudozyma hubeiensis SY62]